MNTGNITSVSTAIFYGKIKKKGQNWLFLQMKKKLLCEISYIKKVIFQGVWRDVGIFMNCNVFVFLSMFYDT